MSKICGQMYPFPLLVGEQRREFSEITKTRGHWREIKEKSGSISEKNLNVAGKPKKPIEREKKGRKKNPKKISKKTNTKNLTEK